MLDYKDIRKRMRMKGEKRGIGIIYTGRRRRWVDVLYTQLHHCVKLFIYHQ
jgi:hypothetical protein